MGNICLQNNNTILDLFTFDLSTFFVEEDYYETHSCEEHGVLMVDYQKPLPWTELSLFDTVSFRFFSEKRKIDGGNYINVNFNAEPYKINLQSVDTLVNQVVSIYGKDNCNRKDLTETEKTFFKKTTIEREWTVGEGKNVYTIKILVVNGTCCTLAILFLNNLIPFITNPVLL
jgi:hypothetical protein